MKPDLFFRILHKSFYVQGTYLFLPKAIEDRGGLSMPLRLPVRYSSAPSCLSRSLRKAGQSDDGSLDLTGLHKAAAHTSTDRH